MRRDSPFAGLWQLIYGRRKIANPISTPRFFSESDDTPQDSFITRQTQPGNEGMHEGDNDNQAMIEIYLI